VPEGARAVLDREMSERAFQDAILDLAALYGWRAYHTHDSRRSQAGFPDLVLVRGQRVVFAELKREGKKPTAEQQRWLDALAATGAVEAYLWRPSDWPEIELVLGGSE
jgi:hypothetical protein